MKNIKKGAIYFKGAANAPHYCQNHSNAPDQLFLGLMRSDLIRTDFLDESSKSRWQKTLSRMKERDSLVRTEIQNLAGYQQVNRGSVRAEESPRPSVVSLPHVSRAGGAIELITSVYENFRASKPHTIYPFFPFTVSRPIGSPAIAMRGRKKSGAEYLQC